MNEAEVVNYIRQVCEGLENMHENNIVHLDIKVRTLIHIIESNFFTLMYLLSVIHSCVRTQPENILCETRKSTNIKLIDFGLATKLDPERPVKVTMATADFAAPEVVEHEPIGFYTDMWSLGVLAYVLLVERISSFYTDDCASNKCSLLQMHYFVNVLNRISGLSPFSGEDDVETLHNISKCSWDFDVDAFKGISENARDFIRRLLTKQPQ